MIILFYFFFILQVASLYFLQTSSMIDPIMYGYIVLDTILLLLFFGIKLRKQIFILLSLSLITRLCFLVYMKTYDIYLSADWAVFLDHARFYMTGLYEKTAIYPLILSYIFTSTGFNCDYTVLPIFLNIFSSVINIYVVYIILNYLNINKRVQTIIIGILCFLPIQCGYSLEMIREVLPTLCISVSLLFFIKWFFSNKVTFIIFAFIFSFVASAFHAGCIAVSLGYACTFVFYDFKKATLQISLHKILFYFPIIILFGIYIVFNGDIFLGKFASVTDMASLETTLGGWAPSINAGSGYLTWLGGASLPVQIACLPLKAFYFLFSPIIFDVRGFQDLFIFFFDTSIFIVAVVCYFAARNKIHDTRLRLLVTILFFIFCIIACVFGLGVSNTGTAMRHRNKFIVFPLVFIAIYYTYCHFRIKK